MYEGIISEIDTHLTSFNLHINAMGRLLKAFCIITKRYKEI